MMSDNNITTPLPAPFSFITFASSEVIATIISQNYPHEVTADENYHVFDPNGYKYLVTASTNKNPMNCVTGGCFLLPSDLRTSFRINLAWVNVLKLRVMKKNKISVEDLDLQLNLPIRHSSESDLNLYLQNPIKFSCSLTEVMNLLEMIDTTKEYILKLDKVYFVVLSSGDYHKVDIITSKDFEKVAIEL